MRQSEFTKLLADLKEKLSDKVLVGYFYGQLYRAQQTEREGAEAVLVTISGSTMVIEEYKLYGLVANKHGGRSYSDSKRKSPQYHQLSHKQCKEVNELFYSIQSSQ